MPKVFLIAGSTGAGKSTYSRKLAEEKSAIVFSIDEWMKTLFWMDAPKDPDITWALERVHRCEAQIWKVAKRVLGGGQGVILDLGFSKRTQRDQFKALAEAEGHAPELHFLDIPVDIRRARVEERNRAKSGTFEFEVDEKMFSFMETFFERPSEEELARATVIRN